MEEVERLTRQTPKSRAERWQQTYRLRLLAERRSELPEEKCPRRSLSLAARSNPMRAGMEPVLELEGRVA